jgi:AcrR family transcriptional regulator
VEQRPAGQDDPGQQAGTARPLRRDAERNRQRILKAAAEVFAERGLEVSLDEVARHAGVGVGTVYRRFPTKDDLIEALFMDRIDEVATLAEQAAQDPDPWAGLVSFMMRRPGWWPGTAACGLRPAADADVRQLRPGQALVRAAAQRSPGRQAGPAGAGGRTAESRPPADRHPVSRLPADRRRTVRPENQPGDLAQVPDPRPGRLAAGTGGRDSPAGRRAVT